MKIAAALIKKAHPLLKPVNTRLLTRVPVSDKPPAPLFIVGPPRSGTTILYQIITNSLRVNYLDNLSHLFYRDLIFGVYLSKKLFRDRAHNCFTSRLGDTFSCGLHAPSECGPFWRLFLPGTKHYLDENDLENLPLPSLNTILSALFHRYTEPWIFKNLVLGMRLKMIARLWPDARILRVKRNPAATVQSILTARKKLNINPDEWWSVRPPAYESFLALPETEMVARQVWAIEQQLDDDLTLFNSQNIITVHYEHQIADTHKLLSSVSTILGGVNNRDNAQPYVYRPGKRSVQPDVSKITEKVFHAG